MREREGANKYLKGCVVCVCVYKCRYHTRYTQEVEGRESYLVLSPVECARRDLEPTPRTRVHQKDTISEGAKNAAAAVLLAAAADGQLEERSPGFFCEYSCELYTADMLKMPNRESVLGWFIEEEEGEEIWNLATQRPPKEQLWYRRCIRSRHRPFLHERR